MGELLEGPATLEQAFTSFRGNFSAAESNRIAQSLGVNGSDWNPAADIYWDGSQIDLRRFPTAMDVVGYLELSRYMRHQLLKDSDVFSMTHGLELRVPLVDTGLFSALHGVPASTRYQLRKKLLIEAVPEIPDYVVGHPKQGFTLPVEGWMRGEWRDLFAGTRRRFGFSLLEPHYRLWSLKTLTYWLKKHGFAAGEPD